MVLAPPAEDLPSWAERVWVESSSVLGSRRPFQVRIFYVPTHVQSQISRYTSLYIFSFSFKNSVAYEILYM